MNTTVAPLLIVAWGNPSRGDDGLGWELLHRLQPSQQQRLAENKLELLQDFQLHIEYAVDLLHRELVLFVDAGVTTPSPFSFRRVHACRDHSFTSHALTPAAVLQVYQQIYHVPAPPSFVLAIHGDQFALGDGLSQTACCHLDAALSFTMALCDQPDLAGWNALCANRE